MTSPKSTTKVSKSDDGCRGAAGLLDAGDCSVVGSTAAGAMSGGPTREAQLGAGERLQLGIRAKPGAQSLLWRLRPSTLGSMSCVFGRSRVIAGSHRVRIPESAVSPLNPNLATTEVPTFLVGVAGQIFEIRGDYQLGRPTTPGFC